MEVSRVFGTQTPTCSCLAANFVHLSKPKLMELAVSMEYGRMHKLSQARSQESAMGFQTRLDEAELSQPSTSLTNVCVEVLNAMF